MSSLINILKNGNFSKYIQINSNQELIETFLKNKKEEGQSEADINLISKVASDLFTSMTKEGRTIKEILDYLDKQYDNKDNNNVDKVFEKISEDIKIIYEPELRKDLGSSKIFVNPLFSIKDTTGKYKGKLQFDFNDKKQFDFKLKLNAFNNTKSSDISLFAGELKIKNALFDKNEKLNNDIKNPSRENPGLCVILHNKKEYRAGTRNSLELQIFINLLTNLELSKIYPYFDAKFFMPSSFLKTSNKTADRFNGMAAGTLHNFLFGNIRNENLNILNSFENKVPGKKIDGKVIDGQITNMSLFTAPQTLNNFNEEYGLIENVLKIDPSYGDKRLTSPHNITAPFLTLKNFTIDVAPTKGLMSFKTGRMSLVLHDRTRLNEVTPFIKPDLFGPIGSDIEVEYGWSHLNGTDSSLLDSAGTNSKDPIADFLHNSRVKERYMIVNSSFTIDSSGQVNIDLSLAMKAPIMFKHVKIDGAPAVSSELIDLATTHKSLMQVIRQFNTSNAAKKDSNKIDYKLKTEIKSIMSVSKINNFSEKQTEEVNKLLRDYSEKKSDKKRYELFGIKFSKQEDKNTVVSLNAHTDKLIDNLKKLQEKINERIAENKNIVGNFGFKTIDEDLTFYSQKWNDRYTALLRKNVDDSIGEQIKSKYVTFGSFLTNLISKYFINHRFYDETQIVFYTLNDSCGLGLDINIASLLINKNELEEFIQDILNNNISLSLEGFITNIVKEFIQTEMQILYGIDDFYDNKEEKPKTQNSKKKSQNSKEKKEAQEAARAKRLKRINNINKRLLKIYDLLESQKIKSNYLNDINLLIPSIHLSFDVFPSANSDKSICRISVYDRNNNPFGTINKIYENSLSNGDLFSKSREIRYLLNSIKQKTNDNAKTELSKLVDKLINTGVIGLNNKDEITVKNDPLFSNKIKNSLKQNMPNLVFGQENSPMIEASVSSINDAKLDTVFMTRTNNATNAIEAKFESNLPLKVKPSQAQVTMIGCPFVNFAQNLFLEFNTGTTIDNQYNVTGLKHDISPGKFTTQVTLSYGEAFGKFETAVNNIALGVEKVKDEKVKTDKSLLEKLKKIREQKNKEAEDKEIKNSTGALKVQESTNRFSLSLNVNSKLINYLNIDRSILSLDSFNIILKSNILLDKKSKLEILNSGMKNKSIEKDILLETNFHIRKSDAIASKNIKLLEMNALNNQKVLKDFENKIPFYKDIKSAINKKENPVGIFIENAIKDIESNENKNLFIPLLGTKNTNLEYLLTPKLNLDARLNQNNTFNIKSTFSSNVSNIRNHDNILFIINSISDDIDIESEMTNMSIEDENFNSDRMAIITKIKQFTNNGNVFKPFKEFYLETNIGFEFNNIKNSICKLIGKNYDMKLQVSLQNFEFIKDKNQIRLMFDLTNFFNLLYNVYEIKKLD